MGFDGARADEQFRSDFPAVSFRRPISKRGVPLGQVFESGFSRQASLRPRRRTRYPEMDGLK